jgi:hypothetical protein
MHGDNARGRKINFEVGTTLQLLFSFAGTAHYLGVLQRRGASSAYHDCLTYLFNTQQYQVPIYGRGMLQDDD